MTERFDNCNITLTKNNQLEVTFSIWKEQKRNGEDTANELEYEKEDDIER